MITRNNTLHLLTLVEGTSGLLCQPLFYLRCDLRTDIFFSPDTSSRTARSQPSTRRWWSGALWTRSGTTPSPTAVCNPETSTTSAWSSPCGTKRRWPATSSWEGSGSELAQVCTKFWKRKVLVGDILRSLYCTGFQIRWLTPLKGCTFCQWLKSFTETLRRLMLFICKKKMLLFSLELVFLLWLLKLADIQYIRGKKPDLWFGWSGKWGPFSFELYTHIECLFCIKWLNRNPV